MKKINYKKNKKKLHFMHEFQLNKRHCVCMCMLTQILEHIFKIKTLLVKIKVESNENKQKILK